MNDIKFKQNAQNATSRYHDLGSRSNAIKRHALPSLLALMLFAFILNTSCASSIVGTITGFNSPYGISTPQAGLLYVVNNGNNSVSVVSTSGTNGLYTFNAPLFADANNEISLLIGSGLAINPTTNQLYATGGGGGGSYSASSPLSISPSNVISISQASATSSGFLSSTDWTVFNNVNLMAYAFTVSPPLAYTNNVITCSACSGNTYYANTITSYSITAGPVQANIINITNTITANFIQANTINANQLYVSYVQLTANPPLSMNYGTNTISISQASATSSGFLSSTDWTTFNNLQSSTGTKYTFNAPLSSNAANGVSLLIGSGLAVNPTTNVLYATGVTATANTPIFLDNTGAISITQSSAASNGFLSSTDWSAFNNKIGSLTQGTGISVSGTTISNLNISLSKLTNTLPLWFNPTTYTLSCPTCGSSSGITSVSNVFPIEVASSNIVSIAQASATSSGYLSAADSGAGRRLLQKTQELGIQVHNNRHTAGSCVSGAAEMV